MVEHLSTILCRECWTVSELLVRERDFCPHCCSHRLLWKWPDGWFYDRPKKTALDAAAEC
jgi:hypothetical protein